MDAIVFVIFMFIMIILVSAIVCGIIEIFTRLIENGKENDV